MSNATKTNATRTASALSTNSGFLPPVDATATELHELGEEYELLTELGRGGMAIVYLARDRQLGREVAIKVMHAAAAADDAAIGRLFAEARTLAQLQHPNIVTIHAVRRLSRNGLALVMQYVPGRSLERAMREDGLFGGERAEAVLGDVAAALAYAHARGVIHRDVKPGNIFLNDETGRALLSDFGIALSAEARSNDVASDVIVGTPAYMSPEQVDGVPLDGRSDVFSLGLVGYDMLAGMRPWVVETPSEVMYRQKYDELPLLSDIRPNVDSRLTDVIEHALIKDRERRTPAASSFLGALIEDEWTPAQRPTPAAANIALPLPEHSGTPRSVPALPPAPPSHDLMQTRHFRRDDAEAVATGEGLPPLWTPRRSTQRRWPIFVVGLLMILAATAVIGVLTPHAVLVSMLPWLTPAPKHVAVHDSVESLRIPPVPVMAAPTEALGRDSSGLVRSDTAHVGESSMIQVPVSAKPVTTTPPAPPKRPRDTVKVASTKTAAPLPAKTAATPTPPAATTPPAPVAAAPATPPVTTLVRALIHPPTPPTIVAGGTHTCALAGDGSAWCWGSNDRGQLGIGSGSGTTRAGIPSKVSTDATFNQISAGLAHSCAVTNAGAAYCWGANDYGQLGDSSTITRLAPVRAAATHSFRQIEVGTTHTCALTGGDIYCWGRNLYGQLGNGSVANTSTPVRAAGDVHFVTLAVGWNHTCALNTVGVAYCWGQNAAGQLGDGTTNVRTTPSAVAGSDSAAFRAIAAGGAHTCAITTDGDAYCWGHNNYGQLGTGDAQDRSTPTKVSTSIAFINITTGSVHSCGLTGAGEIYCWGRNSYGQLGDGTTVDRSEPVRVGSLQTFTSVHASGSHTCARASTGSTYCWGYNSDGQIGDGSVGTRPLPSLVRTQ